MNAVLCRGWNGSWYLTTSEAIDLWRADVLALGANGGATVVWALGRAGTESGARAPDGVGSASGPRTAAARIGEAVGPEREAGGRAVVGRGADSLPGIEWRAASADAVEARDAVRRAVGAENVVHARGASAAGIDLVDARIAGLYARWGTVVLRSADGLASLDENLAAPTETLAAIEAGRGTGADIGRLGIEDAGGAVAAIVAPVGAIAPRHDAGRGLGRTRGFRLSPGIGLDVAAAAGLGGLSVWLIASLTATASRFGRSGFRCTATRGKRRAA